MSDGVMSWWARMSAPATRDEWIDLDVARLWEARTASDLQAAASAALNSIHIWGRDDPFLTYRLASVHALRWHELAALQVDLRAIRRERALEAHPRPGR